MEYIIGINYVDFERCIFFNAQMVNFQTSLWKVGGSIFNSRLFHINLSFFYLNIKTVDGWFRCWFFIIISLSSYKCKISRQRQFWTFYNLIYLNPRMRWKIGIVIMNKRGVFFLVKWKFIQINTYESMMYILEEI